MIVDSAKCLAILLVFLRISVSPDEKDSQGQGARFNQRLIKKQ